MTLCEAREHPDDPNEQLASFGDQRRVGETQFTTRIEDGRALGRGAASHSIEARLLARHELAGAFAILVTTESDARPSWSLKYA